MKNHRPLTLTLSQELSARIKDYIEHTRPQFPGGENKKCGRLWVRFKYGVWEQAGLGRHISRLTEQGLSIRVNPHKFRHAAATTIAQTDGTDAKIIRPLLGHLTGATAEKYYIQAGQISVSRLYQTALKEIMKPGRPKRQFR